MSKIIAGLVTNSVDPNQGCLSHYLGLIKFTYSIPYSFYVLASCDLCFIFLFFFTPVDCLICNLETV